MLHVSSGLPSYCRHLDICGFLGLGIDARIQNDVGSCLGAASPTPEVVCNRDEVIS